ncbi:hypothetical protein EYF80_001833 [Liparis tanakae]|uniref:Uncharacterized protein n=1 Tax=Liparis tanakae TaxID=230148 RepID=A0A4Z2JCC4_9TELE|nr:hypothetical protein EYF80_001833 [Liparis tanakae]
MMKGQAQRVSEPRRHQQYSIRLSQLNYPQGDKDGGGAIALLPADLQGARWVLKALSPWRAFENHCPGLGDLCSPALCLRLRLPRHQRTERPSPCLPAATPSPFPAPALFGPSAGQDSKGRPGVGGGSRP